jgi:small-conductance mechanosensitive channel
VPVQEPSPAWLDQFYQWVHSIPWVQAHLFTVWAFYQYLIIAAAFLGAWLLERWLQPKFEERLRQIQQQPQLLRFLAILLRRLKWIFFAVLLWAAVALILETTWTSRAYFVKVAANLVTAWVLISVASRIIRNRTLAQLIAISVWGLAAVNILGISEQTAALLDSAAFSIGKLRISVLLLIKGAVVLGLLLWGASVAADFLEKRLRASEDLNPSLQVLIAKTLKVTLLAAAVLVALSAIGIDLTALTVFSGAVGLGLGFGLQKVVSNLISGMIILLDKSIKPGDVISLGETFGWITSLRARYVSIVTRDGVEYLIPNEDFISQQVVNWSYSNRLVRLDLEFGVSYDSDPHAVRAIAVEAMKSVERVLESPGAVCHVIGFGDSSINFIARFWIGDPEGGLTNIRGQVFLALWDAFKENGIEIPFPQREVTVKSPVVMASPEGAGAAGS